LEDLFPSPLALSIPIFYFMAPPMHTSCAVSSERQALRTSNLVYGWRTTTRRRHSLQGQRSRSQGYVIYLKIGPNVVPASLEAGGGIPCRPNPAATLLVRLAIYSSNRAQPRCPMQTIKHGVRHFILDCVIEQYTHVTILCHDMCLYRGSTCFKLCDILRCCSPI